MLLKNALAAKFLDIRQEGRPCPSYSDASVFDEQIENGFCSCLVPDRSCDLKNEVVGRRGWFDGLAEFFDVIKNFIQAFCGIFREALEPSQQFIQTFGRLPAFIGSQQPAHARFAEVMDDLKSNPLVRLGVDSQRSAPRQNDQEASGVLIQSGLCKAVGIVATGGA